MDVSGRVRFGSGQRPGESGEVEDRRVAFDAQSRHVVGTCGHLRGRERAEPDPILLPGLADFGYPFAPGPHSDPSVNRVLAAGFSSSLGPFLVRVGRVGASG